MSVAISARSLTKRFRIPLDRSTTIKYRLSHWRSTSRYRDLLAVDDVTFDVSDGEFLGIIGRNGSGKSTLLKLLSRIYRPSGGALMIRGQVSPFLELGVGFNPELTARENVMLNGAVMGLPRKLLQSRMDEMLHFAELDDFADAKLKNFSSGMQVRLAFTVAIQGESGILLMDEVLAVGDARFQAKCFDVFNRYKSEGRTIVLVTHDLGAVELYCDRVLLLEHGRLTADGNAADVTATYRKMVGEMQDAERHVTGGALIDIHDISPSAKRWGNGDVRVRSVELLGGDGTPHVNFTADQPMRISIELEAARNVDDLVVGLGLHRGEGAVVAGTNTQIERLRLPGLRSGERIRVEYSMPHLMVLTGTYRLTVALHPATSTTTYDWLDQAFEFRVTDDRGRAGLFELAGTWAYSKATPWAMSLPGK